MIMACEHEWKINWVRFVEIKDKYLLLPGWMSRSTNECSSIDNDSSIFNKNAIWKRFIGRQFDDVQTQFPQQTDISCMLFFS